MRKVASGSPISSSFDWLQQAKSTPPLPVIPINDFPGPIREEVQNKLEGVKSKPEDAASNGELGMVLDANESPAGGGGLFFASKRS